MLHRNGLIANLPPAIRDELNYRLHNGEPSSDLVEWLNTHPEVIGVLHQRFDGCPVTELHVSEWRKHGYQQWLTLHTIYNESLGASESARLIATTGINCERLLLLLTARYAALIQRWNLTATDQLNYQMGIFRDLSNGVLGLRRAELQTARLQIARERLELLREKQRDKSQSQSSASSPASTSTEPTVTGSASSSTSASPKPPEPIPCDDPESKNLITSSAESAPSNLGSESQQPTLDSQPPNPLPRSPIGCQIDPTARTVRNMFGMV